MVQTKWSTLIWNKNIGKHLKQNLEQFHFFGEYTVSDKSDQGHKSRVIFLSLESQKQNNIFFVKKNTMTYFVQEYIVFI